MILAIYATVLAIFLIDTARFGITPNSTSRKTRELILEHIPSREGKLVDLGSGFGDFAHFITKKTGKEIIGFEGATLPYLVSRLRLLVQRNKRVKILKRDFFKEDLSPYSLVFCYLYRKAMTKLSTKLKRELKPGSWVISHTFAIEGWKPIKTLYSKDLYNTPVYLYRVD